MQDLIWFDGEATWALEAEVKYSVFALFWSAKLSQQEYWELNNFQGVSHGEGQQMSKACSLCCEFSILNQHFRGTETPPS